MRISISLPLLLTFACQPGAEPGLTNPEPAPDDGPVWVDLDAASDATCALDSAGGVLCWGEAALSDASVPPGPYAQIAVSLGRACGLRDDGTLACWGGDDSYGSLYPPQGAFTRVGVGDELACASSDAGSYSCWGRTDVVELPLLADALAFDVAINGLCELDPSGEISCVGYVNPSASSAEQNPPEDVYTGLDVGQGLGCALRAEDGSITCWGNRIGDASGTEPPGVGFVGVSVGSAGACGLDAEGALVCAGAVTPYRDELTITGPFIDVAAGARHVCALRASGEIVCQGDDDQGQSTPPEALNAQG